MAEQKYIVKVAAPAYDDLNKHFYFLAKVSKEAAVRLKNTLLADIRSLAEMPERNPPYMHRGVAYGKYRYKLSARRYRIVYQIDDNVIRVNGIEDCRQDWNNT